MSGAITSKEVFLHWLTIIRLWGARCYLRCLRAIVSRRPGDVIPSDLGRPHSRAWASAEFRE